MRWKCRIARLVRTLRWNALIARWFTPALPPVLHSHHPGSLIMVGEVEVRRSVGRKVKPDIDFYPGDGGEQGQPEKDLIYARLFHLDGSFEIRLNWNNSQNWETANTI